MLEHLTCVFQRRGDGPVTALFGTLPKDLEVPQAAVVTDSRPVIRKLGTGCSIVLRDAHHTLLGAVFDEMPSVRQLPRVAAKLQEMLAEGAFAAGHAGGREQSPAVALAEDLRGARRVRLRASLALAADAVTRMELASAVWAFRCTPRSVSRPIPSDQGLEGLRDQMVQLVKDSRGPDAVQQTITTQSAEEDALPAIILSEQHNAKAVHLSLPPLGKEGYGFLLFDPKVQDPEKLSAALRAVLELNAPTARRWTLRKLATRFAVAAALAGAAVFLSLPTQRHITASALIEPSDVNVVSVHFPTFLDHMHVSVGEQVDRDAPIATLRAPDQENALSEARFQLSSEEAAAKAAFSAGDYGAFAQAEARIELQKTRVAQIEDRLALLASKAPTSGRVISALPQGQIGRHLPVGTEIARIMSGSGYQATLVIAQTDLDVIRPGQTGLLRLRGQGAAPIPLRLVSPPVPERAEDGSPQPVFQALAEIDPEDHDLVPGLTGFAQIDTGSQMRVLVWTRYIRNYVRLKAWTLLGWPL